MLSGAVLRCIRYYRDRNFCQEARELDVYISNFPRSRVHAHNFRVHLNTVAVWVQCSEEATLCVLMEADLPELVSRTLAVEGEPHAI